MPLGRPWGSLEKSGSLPAGQGFLGCGLLRFALPFDHWLKSEADDSDVALECEPLVATVVFEALEEMDEDELLRERLLRVMNIPRTSSEFT